MSEPKLISPLLDGFAVGHPMSNHDGVVCCPAMKETSDQKYILKIISVPASQKQVDALLITGACKDSAAAMEYFRELAEDMSEEASFLQKLSRLEGFMPYEGCQIVPMDGENIGYQVYLLSKYRQTLEKFTRRNSVTHLNAVNLGLDLCACLSICRRAGRMFVDLKPTNIYVSQEKEFRLGDLGFVKLGSLKYTSMPEKYRSVYTAPELHDPMSTLNSTADTYAVGMILYQIYNNGQLPFRDCATNEILPSPANADYEIAEIILKACAPDPANRWKNPLEMGQALVDYMQRNTINDTPIAPPSADVSQNTMPLLDVQGAAQEAPHEELSFMSAMTQDDTAPDEADARNASEADTSDEVSTILTQANVLIDHETPKGVVVPEPVEVPIPLPVDPEPAVAAPAEQMPELCESDVTDVPFVEENHDAGDMTDDYDEYAEEDYDDGEDPLAGSKRHTHKWLAPVIIVLILALLAVGGFYFYQNYYLQSVDGMDVVSFEDTVTVTLDTNIEDSLLTVICADTYGNTKTQAVSNGCAVFSGLMPDTHYRVQIEIDGFHKLTGSTTHSFDTDAVTTIYDFNAFTGTEDGSVVLNFSVDGPDTDEWTVYYGADGEQTRSQTFSGHNVTVDGLTVDQVYRFWLEPKTDLYIQQDATLEFTASRLILAENLEIVSCTGGTLTVQWTNPDGIEGISWTLRCYNQDGGQQQVTTTDTNMTFTGIDHTKAYHVEITAQGMTKNTSTSISANPLTITGVDVDEDDAESLTVSWQYEGTAPADGWILLYRIDDSQTQEIARCEGNSAVVAPRIHGATYTFEIQAADGSTVFDGIHTYAAPQAKDFNEYSLLASHIEAHLLVTPDDQNWSYKTVRKADYTDTFTSGEGISLMLYGTRNFYVPREDVNLLYVIRDHEGNVLTDLTWEETRNWREMWWNDDYHYCELDLPAIPTEPGTYTFDLYFNGASAVTICFTITE